MRLLRLKQGLTLKELAERLGYTSHGYLSEIESGRKVPTVELTLKISSFFRVTTDYLLKNDTKLRT